MVFGTQISLSTYYVNNATITYVYLKTLGRFFLFHILAPRTPCSDSRLPKISTELKNPPLHVYHSLRRGLGRQTARCGSCHTRHPR